MVARSVRRSVLRPLICAFALLVAGLEQPAEAADALQTVDLADDGTPDDLAQLLVGPGITVSNVRFTGATRAAGTFTGGDTIVGFDKGVLLSSGDIANVVGPNDEDDASADNGRAGDVALDALADSRTYDAAVLEFDFVPSKASISMTYVFASEEYNEFVHQGFNDVFGFFVNGENCATLPDPAGPVPVSVDTINNGNPFDSEPREHPELYRNNDLGDGGGDLNTEADGLTTVLACEAELTAGSTNSMRLAIADAGDAIFDAHVFLEEGGLQLGIATVITPQPMVASVTGSASPVVFAPSVTARLSRLRGGAGLSGRELAFFSKTSAQFPDEQPLCSGTTDDGGVASCVPEPAAEAAAVAGGGYHVRFIGDDKFQASESSGSLAHVNEQTLP